MVWVWPDISVVNEKLLYKVTAVIDWQISKILPCRRRLKTSSRHCAISSQLTTEHNELIISREKLTCPREPFDVPLNTGGVLTLWRGDAHFIVLPSVTSVCVLDCLKASPSPQCSQQTSAIWESCQQPCPHCTAVEWLRKTRTATLNRTGLAMGWAPRH